MSTTTTRRSAPRALWDLVRGLAALATLAVLLVGVPVLALPRLGWPLPRGVPSPGGVAEALLHRGLDMPVVLRAAAAVLWVAWAVLSACVLVEAVAWARRRESRPVRGLGGFQRLAANLVLTAALVLPSLPHLAGSPATAAPLPAIGRPAASVVYQAASPSAAPSDAARPAVESPTSPTSSVGAPKAYVVQRYDCLWDIAERHLGDPRRWHEIEVLTDPVTQPGGAHLGDPNLIYPGWTVLLPADAVGLDDVAPLLPLPPRRRHRRTPPRCRRPYLPRPPQRDHGRAGDGGPAGPQRHGCGPRLADGDHRSRADVASADGRPPAPPTTAASAAPSTDDTATTALNAGSVAAPAPPGLGARPAPRRAKATSSHGVSPLTAWGRHLQPVGGHLRVAAAP